MGGVDKVQSFYRLFMAPGMDHCASGIGPNSIGGAYDRPAPVRDAEHDVAAALARWVEQGEAPEKLVATHYQDNEPARGIAAQRPLCVYPAAARYTGRANRNQAASWACTAPDNKKSADKMRRQ
jgi:hypothetical protein